MSDKPAPETNPEFEMQRFRERVTAILAILLVGGFLATGIFSIQFITSQGNEFDRVKDLMALFGPFVGVAIGYYFNNVSTSGRAEAAERTAKAASVTAQEMTGLREDAVRQAEAAQAEVTAANTWKAEVQETLQEVELQANEMAAQVESATAPGGPGTLSGEGMGGGPAPEAWLKARIGLQGALSRAKRMVNK